MLFFLLACSTEPVPSPEIENETEAEARDVGGSPETEAIARAEAAIEKLEATLGRTLQKALAEGGPAAATEVCADKAQGITALIAAEGVKVGRASARVRNPVNKGPTWVRAWLTTHEGTAASELEQTTYVQSGKTVRLIRPISVKPLCLTCHGTPTTEVTAAVAAHYPEDLATGYAEGDLRGAFWAEARVEQQEQAGADGVQTP